MLAWMRDLETAKSVSDVLSLARACVDVLRTEGCRELPEACRARGLRDVDDVRWWSERLSEEYWRRRGLGLDVSGLQDAWSFFLRAAIQCTRLSTRVDAKPQLTRFASF
jgi:hypothetical protein